MERSLFQIEFVATRAAGYLCKAMGWVFLFEKLPKFKTYSYIAIYYKFLLNFWVEAI
jgi:hypothetical protein